MCSQSRGGLRQGWGHYKVLIVSRGVRLGSLASHGPAWNSGGKCAFAFIHIWEGIVDTVLFCGWPEREWGGGNARKWRNGFCWEKQARRLGFGSVVSSRTSGQADFRWPQRPEWGLAETDEKFQLDHTTPHPTLSGALTSLSALSSLCSWLLCDLWAQGLCWNTHLLVRFPTTSRAVLKFPLLRRPLDCLTDSGQAPSAFPWPAYSKLPFPTLCAPGVPALPGDTL